MDLNHLSKLFLFDLDNSAKEHWFQPNENWVLAVANNKEKLVIEKTYHPVISMEGSPKDMSALYFQVMEQIAPGKSVAENDGVYKEDEQVFLLAYNPSRIRK